MNSIFYVITGQNIGFWRLYWARRRVIKGLNQLQRKDQSVFFFQLLQSWRFQSILEYLFWVVTYGSRVRRVVWTPFRYYATLEFAICRFLVVAVAIMGFWALFLNNIAGIRSLVEAVFPLAYEPAAWMSIFPSGIVLGSLVVVSVQASLLVFFKTLREYCLPYLSRLFAVNMSLVISLFWYHGFVDVSWCVPVWWYPESGSSIYYVLIETNEDTEWIRLGIQRIREVCRNVVDLDIRFHIELLKEVFSIKRQ